MVTTRPPIAFTAERNHCAVAVEASKACRLPSVSLHLRFVGIYQDGALDALGDPTRRAIFERLGRGPCAVGELAAELPVSRPAVSQHLKVLKQAGLVADEAVGTRRIYRLDPGGIDAMRAYFTRFWTTATASFREQAEAAARSGNPPRTTTSEESQ